ncbi:MAG: DMT family transporter [Hydrogenophilaceae bacterium]|nr:DMT family transporter [Hydrogenophilaceae bacterium]
MSLPTAFLSVIAIWSTTPLAIKWSAVGAGPSFAVFSRMALGVLLSIGLAAVLRIGLPRHRTAVQTYLAGGLSVFGSMSLTYWAAQYVSSGLISVLFGLSPLVTGIAAAYWLEEKALTPAKVIGMLLGSAGLALVFHEGLTLGTHALAGVSALLGAVLIQSLGLVWIKRIGDDSSPVAINLGSLLVALPGFFAVWWWSDGQWPTAMPERAGAAILYLAAFGSVAGFVLYYYMIRHMETGRVALITLVTPVLALLLGHGLDGETVTANIWLGTAGILLGLSLHQWGERWLPALADRR